MSKLNNFRSNYKHAKQIVHDMLIMLIINIQNEITKKYNAKNTHQFHNQLSAKESTH